MQSICLSYFPHLTVSSPSQREPVCLGQWTRAGTGSKDCLVPISRVQQKSRATRSCMVAIPALGISEWKGPGGLWTCGEPGTGPAVLPVGQGPTALGALGMGRDKQGFGAQLWDTADIALLFSDLEGSGRTFSVSGSTSNKSFIAKKAIYLATSTAHIHI